MRRARFVSRQWAPLSVVALAAACGGDPPPVAMAPTPIGASACLVSREPLVLGDGTEVYVEDQDVIRVGDDLVVAGAPSYHWRPAPGRPADRLSGDAFAAAYLGERARPITKPNAGHLGSVRAAALSDRSWGAMMLEVDPDSLPTSDAFRGLWYGEYDGERWTRLESVESPGSKIPSRVSSGLIRVGDRLVWFAFEQPPSGSRTRVRVYERRAGVWSHYVVPGEERVEQVEAAYVEGMGLLMMVVGPDDRLAGFQKSIRLYRERTLVGAAPVDRWELLGRAVVADPGVELGYASMVLHRTGATLTWSEIGPTFHRARARVGMGPDAPGTLVALDASVSWARAAVLAEGRVVWVVNHAAEDDPELELRLLGFDAGRVTLLGSLASPFQGFFSVRAVAPHEIVVVGADMNFDSVGVPVRSLLLRLRTSC